jgi:hypothetical protein
MTSAMMAEALIRAAVRRTEVEIVELDGRVARSLGLPGSVFRAADEGAMIAAARVALNLLTSRQASLTTAESPSPNTTPPDVARPTVARPDPDVEASSTAP